MCDVSQPLPHKQRQSTKNNILILNEGKIFTGVGISGYALKQDGRGTVSQWAVDDVRVACDPAYISHTGVHIPGSSVKH